MNSGGSFLTRSIGLRFSLSTFAVLIVVVCSGLIVAFNYYQSTKLARETTQAYITNIFAQIELQAGELIAPVPALLNSVATLSKHLVFNDLARTEVLELIDPIMDQAPQITSIYYGTQSGSFTQYVSFVGKTDDFRAPYRADQTKKFAIVNSDVTGLNAGIRRVELINREPDDQPNKIWQENTHYDPRLRPWYGPSLYAETSFRTDPYLFSKSQKPGITFSRPLKGIQHGVVGVDLDLRTLKAFLTKSKITPGTQMAIVTKEGQILAHTETDGVQLERLPNGTLYVRMMRMEERKDDPTLYTAKFVSSAQNQELFEIELNGEPYIGKAIEISLGGTASELLVISVPWNEVIAPMLEARRNSIIIVVSIVLLIVMIAIFIARKIASPVEALRHEAGKLSRLDVQTNDTLIRSNIREIDDLARAMHSTKTALATFGKYVPRALVRRLMESGEGGELGGERRDVVILFSDIEGFTTITERRDVNDMMKQLSGYFDSQSNAILECNGTIDKYIGDAIMAFWNAPDPDPDAARNACIAVQKAKNDLQLSNAQWRDQHQPELHTRYGLHAGTVMVGNIGSDNRMDYTIMGGDVNLASRLEGLNKFFGTQIIGSETVMAAAGKEFLWRKLGLVQPKGTTQPTLTFELCGLRSRLKSHPELPICPRKQADAIDNWNTAFKLYLERHWQTAQNGFAEHLKVQSNDKAAKFYLRQTKKYAQKEPSKSWTGVEKFEVK